jgi:hypothetical protein
MSQSGGACSKELLFRLIRAYGLQAVAWWQGGTLVLISGNLVVVRDLFLLSAYHREPCLTFLI